jgi:hypothetical protein
LLVFSPGVPPVAAGFEDEGVHADATAKGLHCLDLALALALLASPPFVA